jgi:hypothetical protein
MADEFGREAPAPSQEFQAPEAGDVEKGFPSFRYGPSGQKGVFQCAADVPKGWHDHPSKVSGATDPAKAEVEPRRPDKAVIMKDLQRLGVPFNPMTSASTLWTLLKSSREVADKAGAKPKSELQALRERHKALTGKMPSPKATVKQLQAAIDKLERK